MSSQVFPDDDSAMQRALEIARQGVGRVEPNPAVGAVLTTADGHWIAEGYHRKFGNPHAEVEALRVAGHASRGATMYVTLEPCSHHGKTPPCADALLTAGIRRVVVGTEDPAPHVAGHGLAKLRSSGVEVEVGVCRAEADALIAPFRKLFTVGIPFVHAKWAMTLDGKIATRSGSSQWVSNARSRQVVHQLRGRMDAIMTGIGTVLADDPQLTVRPAGARTPSRVVLDSQGRLPIESHLVQTAEVIPVILFVSAQADAEKLSRLQSSGVEVVRVPSETGQRSLDLSHVLADLGTRQYTNVLLEAGGALLGSFWDQRAIDEVHCFIAPKIVGGTGELSPIAGIGIDQMSQAVCLSEQQVVQLDGDVYVRGRLN